MSIRSLPRTERKTRPQLPEIENFRQLALLSIPGVVAFGCMLLMHGLPTAGAMNAWLAASLVLLICCPTLAFLPLVVLWACCARLAEWWEWREKN